MAITKAVALYDYEVQSTNDLALKAGDVVTVIDRSDSDWWLGEIGETQGYFPANYVEVSLRAAIVSGNQPLCLK